MPELTTRDYLSLLGLTLAIVFGILTVRSRIRKNKERREMFRKYLLGRILVFAAHPGLPSIVSKADAVAYVASTIKLVQDDYVSQTGSAFTGNLTTFCDEVVNDLCKNNIIPFNTWLAWG